MKNNKGFTLVELLATISILGIIMLIAVPNILGTVERNKKTTYIEDAKKLVSLAENKMRSDTGQIKPTSGTCNGIVYTLRQLDNGDLSEPPEGGKYDEDLSFVVITYDSSIPTPKYVYKVQLYENITKGSSNLKRGIKLVDSTQLKQDEIEIVNNGWETNIYSTIGGESHKCLGEND